MAGRKRRPPAAETVKPAAAKPKAAAAAAVALPLAVAAPPLAAAQLGLEAASNIAEGLGRLVNTPVIGWERITTYTKGRRYPKTVVEKSTLEIRAWELILAGFVGVLFVSASNQQGGRGGSGQIWSPVTGFLPLLGIH